MMRAVILYRVLFLSCLVHLLKAFRPCKESNKVGNFNAARSRSTILHAANRFKDFEQLLDTFREEPVIIYFGADKCGGCKLMEKELKTVRKMVGDKMKIFSLDTEKWPQVGPRFQVDQLPCLVVFREGEIKLRLEGVNPAETVVEQVRVFL